MRRKLKEVMDRNSEIYQVKKDIQRLEAEVC